MTIEPDQIQAFIESTSGDLKKRPGAFDFNSGLQLNEWKVDLCSKLLGKYDLPDFAREMLYRAAQAASRNNALKFEVCFSKYCESLIIDIDLEESSANSGYGDGQCET